MLDGLCGALIYACLRRRRALEMLRGALGAWIIVLLTAGLVVVEAQQTPPIPRVAVLHPGSSGEPQTVQREPFERGLREAGWTPGASIVVDHRYGEGSATRLTEAANDVVRQGVQVIVARGPVAIRAAQKATRTIPIVMSSADDPIADGFVTNLARPGGNITGIANLVSELDGKRLELLKEAIPGLTRVGVLTNPRMTPQRYRQLMTDLGAIARALGLELSMHEVSQLEDIPEAFAAMQRARVGGLLVRADTQVLEPNRPHVVTLAAKHRVPAMYSWHFYTELGGLMSYATSIPAFHHRSATFVDRILRGAKPGDLPVEQPTKFELVINLKTARTLGLAIPQSMMLRADQVIQ